MAKKRLQTLKKKFESCPRSERDMQSQSRMTLRKAMWIDWVKRKYSAIVKWLGTYHTDLSLTPRNLIVWEEYTMHEQNSWDKVWAIRSTQGQIFSPLCLESSSCFVKEELQWLLMRKKCTICFASLTMTSQRWHSYGETPWEKNRMRISSREQCLEKCLHHPEQKEAKCWWEWGRLTPGCEKQSTSTFTWMMAYHQRILARKLLKCGSRWLSCCAVEVSTYISSDKLPRRLGDHATIPEQDRSPRFFELSEDKLPTDRTWGVIWDAQEDMLWFTGLKGDLRTTRRNILSQAFSVSDPRGLLHPFTIRSKIILQGLNRMKYGWDDELKEADLQEWRE